MNLRAAAAGLRLRLVLAASALMLPQVGQAHALAPGYLDILELPQHHYQILWKTARVRFGPPPQLQFPPQCKASVPPVVEPLSDAVVARWVLDCGSASLRGQRVGVSGLAQSAIDVLVVFTGLDGVRTSTTLRPGEESLKIPNGADAPASFIRYMALGFDHILEGLDHLAFLAGLVLLVRRPGRVAAAVTGFTLGHCVTLCLVSLGVMRAPAGAEALIALSVVLLAREVLAPPGRAGLTVRVPWLVAVPFGLLHGLGFAGALVTIGLPPVAAVAALAGFNAGVELGQLAFIAVLFAAAALGLRRRPLWLDRRAAACLLGVMGAFWTIERVVEPLL